MSKPELTRIGSLDAARGFAALLVAVYHFAGRAPMNGVPWLAPVEQYAWVGVEAFFVVSGFIVPASFIAFGQTLEASSRFMARRLARLYGPYLFAIGLGISLNVLSSVLPGYRGNGEPWPPAVNLACNLSYTCGITSHDWINPVFWSLAIEIQFYLLLVALIPLSMGSPAKVLYALVLLSLLSAAPGVPKSLVIHFLPLFALGWITWCFYRDHVNIMIITPATAITLAVVWNANGTIATIAACATALMILLWRRPPPWVTWLGTISYSLYLIHIPIGGRVVNLALRFEPGSWMLTVVVLVATFISILSAWLLWRFVESPTHRWSRRLFATGSPGGAS